MRFYCIKYNIFIAQMTRLSQWTSHFDKSGYVDPLVLPLYNIYRKQISSGVAFPYENVVYFRFINEFINNSCTRRQGKVETKEDSMSESGTNGE